MSYKIFWTKFYCSGCLNFSKNKIEFITVNHYYQWEHNVWRAEKNTEGKNSKVSKINKGRVILLSTCVICDSKKSRFIKNLEASGL